MVGLLAGHFAFAEYRLMLAFSLRGETMMAEMTLTSVVLLTSVLILTYGLYVPKSWRRAAVVVVPLALLPFAPLPVLALRHPAAMAWLGKGWGSSTPPLALLFTYDGLILIILAVSATFGARTISGLRREVAEARRARPVSPAGADRRRRDGRGLPGRAPAPQAPLRRQADPARGHGRPEGPGPVRARGPDDRLVLPPEHRRGLRLRPLRGRHLLLRHGVPAGPEPGGPGPASRPVAAGAARVSAAASLPGVARSPRGGADPPRHQAVEHHRRAPQRHGRRGQAARLRPGPAPGGVTRAPSDRGRTRCSARRCSWRRSR